MNKPTSNIRSQTRPERLPGTAVAPTKGRHRRAATATVSSARRRGVDPLPVLVTTLYGLTDAFDFCESTGEQRHLIPQLAARILEVVQAAGLASSTVSSDDPWDALARELSAQVGDSPPA